MKFWHRFRLRLGHLRSTQSRSAGDPDELVRKRELWDYEDHRSKAVLRLGSLFWISVLAAFGVNLWQQHKVDENRVKTFNTICGAFQVTASDQADFALAVDLLISDVPPPNTPVAVTQVDKQAKKVYKSARRFAAAECSSRGDLDRLIREYRTQITTPVIPPGGP